MFSTRRCRTTPDGDFAAVSTPNGPVADFCAALRGLQRTSGLSRTALARQLSYGRSQLYEILDGRIKRPPEWDKLVEPLVRACVTGGDRAVVECSVAEWKQRHEVLVRVCEELHRRGIREGVAGDGVLAGCAPDGGRDRGDRGRDPGHVPRAGADPGAGGGGRGRGRARGRC